MMYSPRIFIALLLLIPSAVTAIDFRQDIFPVLEAHCINCHGPEKQKGQLRLDSTTAALRGGDSGEKTIVPGDSSASYLLELIQSTDPDHRMPPKGDALSEEHIDLLKSWIDNDQAWTSAKSELAQVKTDHWSFQPIVRPPVPPSAFANPIDAFVARKLTEQNLPFNPSAEKRILQRRMYLDMIGLLPEDPADDIDTCIEQLLASPHYGERWARHWLDVVRFAESAGFETNHERPNAYHYRDYVIRAFNDDKPYHEFVYEQIAGDSVGRDAATGFIVGGAYDRVKGKDPLLGKMQRQDELSDMVNTMGTAFLGLTVGCAKCHNHKFDPISQTDFFALQSAFAGVQHGERPLRDSEDAERKQQLAEIDTKLAGMQRELDQLERQLPEQRPAVQAHENEELFATLTARLIRFTIEETNNHIEPCIDEIEVWSGETNVAHMATPSSSGNYAGNPKHQLAHINDGKFGNSFSWISDKADTGWIQLTLKEPTEISRITWARDREKVYRDRLPTRYRIEAALDPAGPWAVLASSESRQPFGQTTDTFSLAGLSPEDTKTAQDLLARMEPLKQKRARLQKTTQVYAGKLVQPSEPTRRLFRGDPLAPKEIVAPEGIAILSDQLGSFALAADAPEQARRVALAKWITHPDNPLTARVMVNRLWHYHFGRGIVSTPSDFGAMGFRPTHPELLDWLASELMEQQGSLKHIHRLILQSKTYQQASTPRHDALKKDAGTRWLWRFPPRRLEAEAIRDNILLVAGALDRTMYGPGFLLFEPNSNYSRNWIPKQTFDARDYRRMVYALKLRMEHDAVFGAFDCPDAGSISPARGQSTTPIQALNLYNSPFVIKQAEQFAERAAATTVDEQIQRVFQLAFARAASEAEQQDAAQLVEAHGLPALCRAIFNSNEFLFLP